MSNSTDPRIRVGVGTFSIVSELSSCRALYPSRSAISQTLAGWRMFFRFRRVGSDKVAREATRCVSRVGP